MYVMPNSTVSDTTRESAQPDFSHSLQRLCTAHDGTAASLLPEREQTHHQPLDSPHFGRSHALLRCGDDAPQFVRVADRPAGGVVVIEAAIGGSRRVMPGAQSRT